MAANRRRLVHRLQAGDPLDLPASGTIIPLGLAGLGRHNRRSTSTQHHKSFRGACYGTEKIRPAGYFIGKTKCESVKYGKDV